MSVDAKMGAYAIEPETQDGQFLNAYTPDSPIKE